MLWKNPNGSFKSYIKNNCHKHIGYPKLNHLILTTTNLSVEFTIDFEKNLFNFV